MRTMLLLLVLLLVKGSTSGISCPKTITLNACSEYEVLHTNPPCCEATCEMDCCRVVCPKMLIYEPTCVCVEGYVRHNGNCIPKAGCPASLPYTTTPAPCVTTKPTPYATTPSSTYPTTAAPPCTTTKPPCPTTKPPCPTTKPTYPTTKPPCPTTKPPCSTTKPPCPTTKPPCSTTKPPCTTTKPPCTTTKAPYVQTSPKPCVYTTQPHYKRPQVTLVPPPPPPSYKTLPPFRYYSVSSPRSTAVSYPTSPAQPKTYATSPKSTAACTTPPPTCSTTPSYSPTTPKPYLTTSAPCPTTPTPCPPSTPPPPPPPPAKTCAACEQLVLRKPCCEPTCEVDCSDSVSCPLVLVEEATCTCRPGLVRFHGHCIEPTACPRSASRYRLYVPVAAQCLMCSK